MKITRDAVDPETGEHVQITERYVNWGGWALALGTLAFVTIIVVAAILAQ